MKYIYIFTFFQNLFFSILGTKDCPSKGNEITLEDLKEGFERLKIKVEDNKIILRILDKLRGRCLHDIGEESLQYVMNYAKKFHPKMTTLNQDFVDALADSIINNTIIGAIINYIGDQSEEVEKADEEAEEGGNQGGHQEDEVTMQDLKEVFGRLKIRVDNDNIIRKILNLLRDYNIHDRREESIQYVMKYAKKLHAKRIHSKMNILNQGFVESLEKSILSLPIQFGEITFDNDCEEAEDSDDEPPPKRPKRPKRSSRKAKKDAKRKLKKSNNSNFSKKEKKNGKPNLKTSNISNSSKKKIKGANKKQKICSNSNINKKKKDVNGGQKKSKNSNLSKKEKKNAKAKTKKSRNSNSTKKKKKDADKKLKKSSRLSSTKKAKKIQKNN